MMTTSISFGSSDVARFKSRLCCLPTVWAYAGFVNASEASVLICKTNTQNAALYSCLSESGDSHGQHAVTLCAPHPGSGRP